MKNTARESWMMACALSQTIAGNAPNPVGNVKTLLARAVVQAMPATCLPVTLTNIALIGNLKTTVTS